MIESSVITGLPLFYLRQRALGQCIAFSEPSRQKDATWRRSIQADWGVTGRVTLREPTDWSMPSLMMMSVPFVSDNSRYRDTFDVSMCPYRDFHTGALPTELSDSVPTGRQMQDLSNINFWATRLSSCAYLPQRQERKILTQLTSDEAPELYDKLARSGFRRSHNWAYRPQCPGCIACVPVRVCCGRFRPTRSMTRTLRKNRDLQFHWCPPVATEEQFALFETYVGQRHQQGEMANMGWSEYRAMIEDAPVEVAVVEWRDQSGQLRAAMLVDRISDGLSAVYSFFDPSRHKDSLGIFMVLSLIDQCVEQGLDYVYLGYWIGESTKMAYKSRFRPLEAYGATGWKVLELE